MRGTWLFLRRLVEPDIPLLLTLLRKIRSDKGRCGGAPSFFRCLPTSRRPGEEDSLEIQPWNDTRYPEAIVTVMVGKGEHEISLPFSLTLRRLKWDRVLDSHQTRVQLTLGTPLLS